MLEKTPTPEESADAALAPGGAARTLEQINQSLYSISLLAAGWEMMAEQGHLDIEQAAGGFKRVGDICQQSLKEMRLLVYQLRPSVLAEAGLVEALKQRLDTVEHRNSDETRLLIEGEVRGLPRAVEEGLFHIAQEALDNALRYAHATSVTVCIRAEDGRIILSVADNGIGFDPSANSVRVGLANMKGRAAAIGGELSITSTLQEGTQVEVSVALKPDEGHH